MSDDKMKDRLAILEELNNVAGGLDGLEDQFSDFDAAMMEMAALGGGLGDGLGGMNGLGDGFGGMNGLGDEGLDTLGGMGDMLGMGGMPPIPGMAGLGGFGIGAKEVGAYDTVIVHGMRGNYVLTFEETEEGLEITVKR